MLDPTQYVRDRMAEGMTFDQACAEYRQQLARYVETLRRV